MALAENAKNMFKEELKNLSNTQDFISEVSTLMLIQWRYAKDLVGVWEKRLLEVTDAKKILALFYLGHEILIKAHKKKKTGILDAFADVLGKVVRQVLVVDTTDDELVERKLNRLVRLWKGQNILAESTISILEEALGIPSRRQTQNNDMDDESKTFMDSEEVKLIPEAEKMLKTLKEISRETIAAEWLFDEVSNIQEKLELIEQNENNVKIEKVDDEEYDDEDEEDDDEQVIDLVNAASVLERYKASLKTRLDRHNESIERIKRLQDVLPNLIFDSKIVNEDEKLKEMTPKLVEYSTLYDKCCRKDVELKELNEKKRKREESENVEKNAKEKMMMNVSNGFTGGFQSNNMPMMGGYGFGGGGGGGMQPQMQQFGNSQQHTYPYQQQQRQMQQQFRNSGQQTYQKQYNNNNASSSSGYGGRTTESYNESYNNYAVPPRSYNNSAPSRSYNNSGRRSESYNNSGPPPAGRGRAMTTPAWMKNSK
eukprot:g2645.t1